MAADNMYWCTCGLYNTFLASLFSLNTGVVLWRFLFSEIWIWATFFIYLFYFYDSGDEYQATRESFPILYVIPSYTNKLCEDFESARDWTVLIHLLIYINTYEKLCEMGRMLYLDLSVEEVRPFLDKMLIPLSSSLLFSFLYIVSFVNL